MKHFDILIIGGGPAGMFATYVAHVKGLKPLLIESNEYLGGQPISLYSQKAIHDYPGFNEIKAYQLSQMFINQIKKTPVKMFLSTTVNSLKKSLNKFVVNLSNKQTISCHAIIIACGIGAFKPVELECSNVKSTNIKYIVDCVKDFKNKNVVVLGGGDSAVDWANELSKHIGAKSVTIIHRRSDFRANGNNVKHLKTNKVKVYLDQKINSVQKNKLILVNNKTQKETMLLFDLLLVQYGQKFDHSLLTNFKNIKINDQKRIYVDINQMTNINNIYAIGNVCIYKDKPSSIICAHGEAAVAVRSILNDIKKYDHK